jgi:hypothetical protein
MAYLADDDYHYHQHNQKSNPTTQKLCAQLLAHAVELLKRASTARHVLLLLLLLEKLSGPYCAFVEFILLPGG